jgi:pyruvate formate lyase activating enzyme
MYPALLWEKLPDNRVRCHTCQWFCRINEGQTGVCRMYRNDAGALFNLNYAKISALAVDPIEKKPLYHFHPGSNVFSLGSWGCNFHCRGCQNWEIACPEDENGLRYSREILPERAVEMACQSGSAGIAWTYNEPSVWLEYTLETARLAKAQGLYTVYVTNGYASEAQLDAIGPFLDAWRVDVKGFNDQSYRKIGRVQNFQGVLRVTERARHKWGMHVEVVTNVILGINDDDIQLRGIAEWIAGSISPLTPWHITRFHPRRQMQDYPVTPLETMERALSLGKAAGLAFVYLGNVGGNDSNDTLCYNCGHKVVKRSGYSAQITGLDGTHCRFCGTELNFRV